MAVRHDPQTRMDETRYENHALEEQLQLKTDYADDAKSFNRAARKVKAIIKEAKLEPGLYRCGEFRFRISAISGGPTEIKQWESIRLTLEEEENDGE